MSKTALIIKREYLTRIRKKSFIIMTIIGPMLFGAFLILPAWLANVEDNEKKIIAVVETNERNLTIPDSLRFFNVFPDNNYLKFQYVNAPLDILKKSLPHSEYYGILHIPYNVMNLEMVEFFAKKQPSLGIEDYITNNLGEYIYKLKLRKNNISLEVLNSAQTNIKLKITKLDNEGEYREQGDNELRRWVGYVTGFLIYFFIFFFGSQVMRGVIEEKTSRIIEVIISSVKPFQLMMGKIIGIGLIGLTQFLAWIILTSCVVFAAQQFIGVNKNSAPEEIVAQNYFNNQTITANIESPAVNQEFENLFDQLSEIKFFTIILSFIFYFISGFLLYGSLFAAIGAAVDSETDTQQFMLPVTIPLIFSLIMMVSAFTNPEGKLAVIFSIIPFTSPIIMMARIGFEIPVSQVILSMVLLILTIVFTIWFAGKIYRTGILMYGKKATYKELWKWIKYKN